MWSGSGAADDRPVETPLDATETEPRLLVSRVRRERLLEPPPRSGEVIATVETGSAPPGARRRATTRAG